MRNLRLISFVLTMPVIGWASAQTIEDGVADTEYSARPDGRDCAPPECGGYFLYEIDDTIQAGNQDFCTADLPLTAYVVRCMCPIGPGLLVEFYPSCNKPIVGDIEPDPDYQNYYMLVSLSCAQ